MASLSYLICNTIRCSSTRDNHDPGKQKLNKIQVNVATSMSTTKVNVMSQVQGVSITPIPENGHSTEEQIRQNIPTKKQFVDSYRQGLIIEEGVGYRQTVVTRSYEVGPDKTATIESILNLLQVDWVMMNQQTRRLSKMPEEVRAEISPWFIEKQSIKEDAPEKIEKLDDKAKFLNSDLKPKRSDLDMNHHVNNVKYVGWMLETIPDQFLEDHQLSNIVLEYRRECGSSDIVQSLCEPYEDGILKDGVQQENNITLLNGFSVAPGILEGNGFMGSFDVGIFKYTHLLRVKGKDKNEEIVRGRTTWKKKLSTRPFVT